MEQQFHTSRRSFAIWLASAVSFFAVLTGCDEGVETPEQTVLSFFSDLRMGEPEAAMDAVWPPTRAVIEGAYEDLEVYLDRPSPRDREELLVVTRLESPMMIARIRAEGDLPETPKDGQEILVAIEFRDDRRASVPVRWGSEAGRWFVDLPVEQRQPLQIGGLPDPAQEGPAEEDDAPIAAPAEADQADQADLQPDEIPSHE